MFANKSSSLTKRRDDVAHEDVVNDRDKREVWVVLVVVKLLQEENAGEPHIQYAETRNLPWRCKIVVLSCYAAEHLNR